jgi:hypothetical protein
MLADQTQGFAQGNTKALEVAKTYALLGQNKEALAYLEKAYQLHEYELITIVGTPAFRNIRPDPQFQDLLHRLGLSLPYPN